ncbi:hypothetical protein WMF31_35880 [Sorangium sp. So ce1036]|uniref:hypothetical protein n=1 Tax=Sorangium sp. So ce1036 TaxID=3133328 RepID=UPI003F09758D
MSSVSRSMPFQRLIEFLDSKIAATSGLQCMGSEQVRRLTPRDALGASPSFQTVTVMRLRQGSSPVPTVLVLVDLGGQGPAALGSPDDYDVKKLVSDLETASLVVRTQLKKIEEADELVLWFIAPAGAGTHPGWKALRQEALRDTSVCPKNGWLPARDPQRWDDELTAFFDETFLGTPWNFESDAGTDGIGEVDLVTAAKIDHRDFETFRAALFGDGTNRKRFEGTVSDLTGPPEVPLADPVDALWVWAATNTSAQKDGR